MAKCLPGLMRAFGIAMLASCLAGCRFEGAPNLAGGRVPEDRPGPSPRSVERAVRGSTLPVVAIDAPPLSVPSPQVESALGPSFETVELGAPRGFRPDYYVTGQAWGDYDQDGWLDLYLTDSTGPNRLLHNDGQGGFDLVEDAGEIGLADAVSGGAIFVDYDNDGDEDLYVLNLGPDVMFRNEGGVFVDVTGEIGLGNPGKGETATFGDYDGDGLLDLYVANWFCYECRLGDHDAARDHLYHNDGEGKFTEVSSLLDLDHLSGLGFVASFFDYDGDGDVDLYLVNDKGSPGEPASDRPLNRNVLWRNDGSGCNGWCFTELAIPSGADARIDGMGLAVGDYDGDGDLDLYMSNTGAEVLLRQENGGFSNVSAEAGVIAGNTSWGTAFIDYDADGDLDLYVAVGRVFGFGNANRLFENRGDGTFADVSAESGADDPRYSIGVAVADYDRDGGIDLVVGDWDVGYQLFHHRPLPASAGWLSVRLLGDGAVNHDAVGAQVIARLSDGRSLLRAVIAGTSLGSGSDLALYFGLGSAEVDTLEVRWPDRTVELYGRQDRNREIVLRYGQ